MRNRIFKVILCVIALLVLIPAVMSSANIMGDVNGDGFVKAEDARLALRASVGLQTLTEAQKKAADTTLDGFVKAEDARRILRASVNLETLHTHSHTSKVTKAATCTADGVKTFTCSCGDTYTEVISKTGHNTVTDRAVAATCTATGKTEGSHCSRCGTVFKAQTTVNKKSHTEKTREISRVNATCTKDGSYVTETYCSVCNASIRKVTTAIPAGHSYQKHTVAATCLTDGFIYDKCKACGHEDMSNLTPGEKAKGQHSFSDKTSVPATCTEQGYTQKSCTVCHEVFKDNFTAAKGHNIDWLGVPPTKEPTCTSTGLMTDTCSTCGKAETKVLPLASCVADKTGTHQTSKYIERVNGNGNTPCKDVYYCIKCEKKMYEVENHTVSRIATQEKTCTQNATETFKCDFCDYSYTDIKEVTTGHNAQIDLAQSEFATCEEPGHIRYLENCLDCGEPVAGVTVDLPAKGHDEMGKQTCTTSVTCTVCRKVTKEAFGHDKVAGWSTDALALFCTRCGAEPDSSKAGRINTFNALTSSYKQAFRTRYIQYITKQTTDSDLRSIDFGMFTSMIRDEYEKEMNKTDVQYSIIGQRNTKAFAVAEDHFSLLTADDIDSITVTRLSGITGAEILKDFPDTYTVGSYTVDLKNNEDTDYKNLDIRQNVIKVTIDVKNESIYTINKSPDVMTSLEKIYSLDIRDQVKGYTLSGGKYVQENTDESGMSMKMVIEALESDAKITYYFLEDSSKPIMAVYDVYNILDSTVSMNFTMGITIKGSMRPVVETHTTSAYIFGDTLKAFN